MNYKIVISLALVAAGAYATYDFYLRGSYVLSILGLSVGLLSLWILVDEVRDIFYKITDQP